MTENRNALAHGQHRWFGTFEFGVFVLVSDLEIRNSNFNNYFLDYGG